MVTHVREDLNLCDKEFETIWIEIKNKQSKNIVIVCIYIYIDPHSTNIDWILYLSKCLYKLNKENKDVYVAGGLNINLLDYNTNNKYCNFII